MRLSGYRRDYEFPLDGAGLSRVHSSLSCTSYRRVRSWIGGWSTMLGRERGRGSDDRASRRLGGMPVCLGVDPSFRLLEAQLSDDLVDPVVTSGGFG